jgi:hypothetical protein
MNKQREKAYGVGRLESKTARAAIIQKIATDFNLMPIIAEAYYKQISSYFVQHADIELTSGQICYEAVAANEPAGKHIALTRKVSCRLTLNDVNTDFETRERRNDHPIIQRLGHLEAKLHSRYKNLPCNFLLPEKRNVWSN